MPETSGLKKTSKHAGRPEPFTAADPYPTSRWFRVNSMSYNDHLQLVRYDNRPEGSDPKSLWQVVTDYSVDLDIAYIDNDGQPEQKVLTITVPGGFYTDLSSIPWFGRWLISMVGPHLEASIVHDYLYMKWTDRGLHRPRKYDRLFADDVLRAALRRLTDSTTLQRFFINYAVSMFGGYVFRKRTERLSDQMKRWRPHLTQLSGAVLEKAAAKQPGFRHYRTNIIRGLICLTIILMALRLLQNIPNHPKLLDAIVDKTTIALTCTLSVFGAAVILSLIAYGLKRLFFRPRLTH